MNVLLYLLVTLFDQSDALQCLTRQKLGAYDARQHIKFQMSNYTANNARHYRSRANYLSHLTYQSKNAEIKKV